MPHDTDTSSPWLQLEIFHPVRPFWGQSAIDLSLPRQSKLSNQIGPVPGPYRVPIAVPLYLQYMLHDVYLIDFAVLLLHHSRLRFSTQHCRSSAANAQIIVVCKKSLSLHYFPNANSNVNSYCLSDSTDYHPDHIFWVTSVLTRDAMLPQCALSLYVRPSVRPSVCHMSVLYQNG